MRVVRDWEPVTESEQTAYAESVPAAAKFWNGRRERIIGSQRGVPRLEWCVVILGGIVTVGLTYVFVFDDLRIQITLTAMVALLISLNIFLILMFGYPYSGDLSVAPESFRAALAAVSLGAPLHQSPGQSSPTGPAESGVPADSMPVDSAGQRTVNADPPRRCTLHYLLTGRSPYSGETLIERLIAHRERAIPTLSTDVADAPAVVDELLRRSPRQVAGGATFCRLTT